MVFREMARDRHMRSFIGIDAFPRGWVAAYLHEDGSQEFDYAPTVDRLLTVPYSRAMIDVPIGLPPRGYRACDIEAIGRVGSRVFLGARWGVWSFKCYKDANARYWSDNDKGIPKQLWCIRDNLRQINQLMTPELQSRFLETHPELVFLRLNGDRQLDPKNSIPGRAQRVSILQENGFGQIDRWLNQRYGTHIKRDDLIDACACAIAARDSKERLPTHRNPPIDERGIRMEIWY